MKDAIKEGLSEKSKMKDDKVFDRGKGEQKPNANTKESVSKGGKSFTIC